MNMARQVCAQPGCSIIVVNGSCAQHRLADQHARGTTSQHAYDTSPFSQRALWAPVVRTGKVRCRVCHRYVQSGTAWKLGHPEDSTRPPHPQHLACGTVSRRSR